MSFSDASIPPPPEPTPPPAAPGVTLRLPALRRDGVTVALGVAFLTAAVVVSTSRARSRGDLDLSVWSVGLVATLVLLGFGLAARLLVADRDAVTTLASWPLAFGTGSAGVVLANALDDGTSTTYLCGLLVIALAAASYVAVPSAPPVVAGIFGVLAVYGQAFDDAVGVDVAGDDNGFKTFAVAVLVFVALVTAIGWALPPARTTVAIVVGVGAIVAYVGIMAAIGFTAAFSSFSFDDSGPVETPSYDGDVYTTFLLATLLVVGWMVLGYLTDSAGFRVLVVAMVASVFPAGVTLLAVEHPTGWAVGAGVIGVAVLGVVGLRATTTTRGQAG